MTNTFETPEQWYNKTWLVVLLCLFVFPVGLYALWRSTKASQGWKLAGTAAIAFMVILAATDKPEASPRSKPAPASTGATSHEPAPHEPDSTRKTSTTPLQAEQSLAPSPANDAPPSDDQTAKNEPYLFETTADFKSGFNKYCASTDLDFSIGDLNVKEGEIQNTFQYMLTDNLGLIGSVNKSTGKVIEIMMIGSGDGTFKSGSNIFLCMGAIIAAIDPSLPPAKRGDILRELGLIGNKKVDITDMEGKTEKDGIKYFVASNKTTGLMFSASRK